MNATPPGVISGALISRDGGGVISGILTFVWESAGLAGCRFESRPGLLRTKVYSAFHPSGVGKWVPVIAGKAKAGMAHSDCGWTCGCAGKTVKSLENTYHTWVLLWWWFTMKRRYTFTFTFRVTVGGGNHTRVTVRLHSDGFDFE